MSIGENIKYGSYQASVHTNEKTDRFYEPLGNSNKHDSHIAYQTVSYPNQYTEYGKLTKSKIINPEHDSSTIQPNYSSKLLSSKSMTNLKIRNKFQNTDKLYDPLRKIIQIPNEPILNEFKSPRAFLFSKLPSNYNRLSFCENLQIEKQTLIPNDIQLLPTKNIQNVKNKQFRIINASEKVVGKQMSYQEVQKIIKSEPKHQIIVYELKLEQIINKKQQESDIVSKEDKNTKPKSSILQSMLSSINHEEQNLNNYKYNKNIDYNQGVNQFNERVDKRIKQIKEGLLDIKKLGHCLSSSKLNNENQRKKIENEENFKDQDVKCQQFLASNTLKSYKSEQKLLRTQSKDILLSYNSIQLDQNSIEGKNSDKNLQTSIKIFPISTPIQKYFQSSKQFEKTQVDQRKIDKKEFILFFNDKCNVLESIESKLQDRESKVIPSSHYKHPDNTLKRNFVSSQNLVESLDSFDIVQTTQR